MNFYSWALLDMHLDDDDDDDDVYLKKITTRVSQNLILSKNTDQPNA
jgi:hypothetical protein